MAEPIGPYGPLVETRLRVLTWNLWWRFGPWERRQPAIEATLRDVDADLIALQEVWSADDGDQAGGLAEALGFEYAYAARSDVDGVRFGNAVLSRWPIAGTEWRPLPAGDADAENRLVLRADIDGPRGPIQFFCTHLNWRFDHSGVRQEQVREVCRFVGDSRPREYPPVLCGDLNADPDSDEIRMLTGRAAVPVPKLVFKDAWEVAGEGPGLTWANDNPYARLGLEPERRIDHVMVGWPKAGGRGHVVRAALAGVEAIDGVQPSDHYGVVAELRY
jgi:endonuclease/exonuclease/phosphatase family metal-dependent hydrolase